MLTIENGWDQEDKDFRNLLSKVRKSGGSFTEFTNLFEYDIIQKLWFGQADQTGFRYSEILQKHMPKSLMTQTQRKYKSVTKRKSGKISRSFNDNEINILRIFF